MAKDAGLMVAHGRNEPGYIIGKNLDAVIADLTGLFAEPIAALIGCHYAVACIRKGHHGREHSAPKLRKAVQGNDEWAIFWPRDRAM